MSTVTPLEARTASMRQALLRNLVFLTLLTAGTILTVTLVAGYRSVQELSRSLIASVAGQTESRLRRFFDPVVSALETSRGWARSGALDFGDNGSLNALFMPLLEQLPAVSSVILATTDGQEYMLVRGGDGWWNRRTKVENWGSRTRWSAWRDPGTLVKEEWRELNYDPRKRPWHVGALANARQDGPSHYWTEPYVFFTSKAPGITVSSWVEGKDGTLLIIALDVLLTDISAFTSQLKVSERGMAMVLAPDARVLGVPRDARFRDRRAIQQAVLSQPETLGVDALADAVARWRTDGEIRARNLSFRSGGETWWAGFQPFALSPQRRLWIGVAVPSDDFMLPVKRQRNTMVLITVFALVVAVVMALLMDRTFRRKVHRAVQAARQIGQYTLQKEVGKGAMGSVFQAQHAMLRRPTAIKLLRADLVDNERAMTRFEREAQLTSRLNHPHTIAIYDYGKTRDAVFYYAMEFLNGTDLQTLVRYTGPLPPARVLYLLQQVCGSLDEAHDIGLVHRDVKPSNIMLTERAGDPDFVKVLDFGLVKELGVNDDVELTTADTLAGTPLYISPEAINDPRTVGPASDLYALGAVGYFLLTGKPVFTGRNLVEVCGQHLHRCPKPPSQRLGQPLPGDVETVILACLAKKPSERPASGGELAAELAQCKDATDWGPVQARQWWAAQPDLRPVGPGVEPATAARRHPFALNVDLRSR